MTDIEVHLKALDESTQFVSPNRALEIKTNKGIISTPTRASTSYEFKRKAQIPTDIPFENDISVNIQKLNFDNLKQLLTTNEYLGKLSRKIDLNNRLEQYSKLRVTILQPTSSPSKDQEKGSVYPSGIDLLRNSPEHLEKFISIVINTQIRMGLDVISIPFLDLPPTTYKKLISKVSKTLEQLHCYPFFVIDMKYDGFSQIIDYIISDSQSRIIGLYFRDYLKSVQSYYALSKHAEKEVVFFSMQVERIDYLRNSISAMNYLPFFANDIYSVEIPSQFVPNPKKKSATSFNLGNIRLFSQSTLQVNEIAFNSCLDDKIVNDYKGDRIIQEMLENYTEAATDERKYGMLNAFSKVDELRSSLSEFNRLRKYIAQDSTKDYLDEKETLKRVLQPMSSKKVTSFF